MDNLTAPKPSVTVPTGRLPLGKIPLPHRGKHLFLGLVIAISIAGISFLVVTRIRQYQSGFGETVVPYSTLVPDVVLPEIPDLFPDDLDRDGISNAEEEAMGLSPTEYDSDRDGLPDREEIDTWNTDPKNVDSDGDGYADGFEVLNGFDPLGPGQLGGQENAPASPQ